MKAFLFPLFMLLFFCGNAQLSIYTENVEILRYNYDRSKYQPQSFAAIGLGYQYDVHEYVFFESRLSGRFDRIDGLLWSNGFYFNRTPDVERFIFLTGVGIVADGYNNQYDYYVETRIRLNMGLLGVEGSGSFNLKENFNKGPSPKGAIRVIYQLHW